MSKRCHIFLIALVAALGASCAGGPTSPTDTTDSPTTTTETTTTPAPAITFISPAVLSEDGGTSVEITGTDFTNVTAVTFGTTAALSYTVNSTESITAVAPAATGTGNITIVATAGTSTPSDADRFEWIPNALTDFVFDASVVKSGSPVRGTVTLTFPAPAGGLSLNLTWSSTAGSTTAVIVPLVVRVSSGATTGSFQITTFYTSSTETISMSTEHGDAGRTAAFVLTP